MSGKQDNKVVFLILYSLAGKPAGKIRRVLFVVLFYQCMFGKVFKPAVKGLSTYSSLPYCCGRVEMLYIYNFHHLSVRNVSQAWRSKNDQVQSAPHPNPSSPPVLRNRGSPGMSFFSKPTPQNDFFAVKAMAPQSQYSNAFVSPTLNNPLGGVFHQGRLDGPNFPLQR